MVDLGLGAAHHRLSGSNPLATRLGQTVGASHVAKRLIDRNHEFVGQLSGGRNCIRQPLASFIAPGRDLRGILFRRLQLGTRLVVFVARRRQHILPVCRRAGDRGLWLCRESQPRSDGAQQSRQACGDPGIRFR